MSININNEFEIIQNELLGVHALHEFVRSYTENNKGTGPKLFWAFPVLPILFNAESANLIYTRSFSPGSFIKIINEKSDVFLTLQRRMENMANKTFNCIRMAANAGLFSYDGESLRLYIVKNKSIVTDTTRLSKDYQQILFASKRLGTWFAKLTEEELLIYLNIKF